MRAPAGRPWPITVLCVALGLLLAWAWGHALAGTTASAFGPGYWPYLASTSIALAVPLWGLWRLRGWARWAFPAALLLDDAVVGVMGELRPAVLAVQAAAVLVVLAHSRAFERPPRGRETAAPP